MSSSHNVRTSRKEEIPRKFMLNFQASGPSGGKSLVRRPMTACEACRTAKVKCNGQQECDRCSARGLKCRYTTTILTSENSDHSPQRSQQTSIHEAWLPQAQTTPEDTTMDSEVNTADPFGLDDTIYEQGLGAGLEWSNTEARQRFGQFDWENMDVNFHGQIFDASSHFSLNNSDPVQAMTNLEPHNATSRTPTSQSGSSNSTTAQLYSPSNSSNQNQLPVGYCPCRADLVLLIPKVKSVVEERRLDEVFKVTGDVIRNCQKMINCQSCEVSCTDLIFIVSVFQRTDICFEYIAKGDLASVIKVSVGEYEVSITNDTQFRHMLAMDIVKQATTLLDLLNVKSQNMEASPLAPCRMGKVHLEYLEAVIEDLRNVLRTATNWIDEAT